LLQGIAPLLINRGQGWDTAACAQDNTLNPLQTKLNMLAATILLLFRQVNV